MASKALNLKIPRLGRNRHGVFYVRSSVPSGASGGRKVHQQSLGTKDPHLARILGLRFCLALAEGGSMSDLRRLTGRYELDLEDGTAKAEGPEDHARMMDAMKAMREVMELQAKVLAARAQARIAEATPASPAAPQGAADLMAAVSQVLAASLPSVKKPYNVGLKLREAFDKHLAEEALRVKSDRTVQEKRALFKDFVEVFGDIHLNMITLTDITDRWRDVEYHRENQKRKGTKVSLGRLEKRRGFLYKFFNAAKESGLYMHENPVQRKMASKKEIRQHTTPYKEYTNEDLALLFGPGYLLNMNKPDWYWLPLMSLFSGARQGELANLALDSFQVTDGIKVFLVNDGKTLESRRTVPIHPVLLDLGLWSYVEHLKSLGQDYLVPHRPPKIRSKSIGDQWAKWVDRCGITDKSKVFHSFRSTAITDMYNGAAPNSAAIRDSVGHAGGLNGAHGGYVRGIALQLLLEAIKSLSYSTVDPSALKLPDPTFAPFLEKELARKVSPRYLEQQEGRKRHAAAKAAREARVTRQRKGKADGTD